MASDWGTLIGQLVGLGGVGMGLAGQAQMQGRQNTAYDQMQALYQQLLGLANQQQGRLDTQYGQQQDWYTQLQQMIAGDRANQQAAYQQQVGQTAFDRWNAQQAYQQQVGQVGADRANIANTLAQRNAIAGRLADPSQVLAGAQALYQPLSNAMRDDVLRGVSSSLASRGLSGGTASATLEEALAPYILQQQQLGMQNFLGSQQAALGGYTYAPTGPYTPTPQGGPYTPTPQAGPYTPNPQVGLYPGAPPSPPRVADFPGVPTFFPGAQNGMGMPQALQALGGILGGVGGGPGIIQSIAGLLGQAGGNMAGQMGDSSTAGVLGGNYFGESPYGSDIPGMATGGFSGDSLTFDTGSLPYDFGFE